MSDFQDPRRSLKKSVLIFVALVNLALGASVDRIRAASTNDAASNHPTYNASLELSAYNLLFAKVKINDRDAKMIRLSGA